MAARAAWEATRAAWEAARARPEMAVWNKSPKSSKRPQEGPNAPKPRNGTFV